MQLAVSAQLPTVSLQSDVLDTLQHGSAPGGTAVSPEATAAFDTPAANYKYDEKNVK